MTETLTLRMPSRLHEVFIARVVEEIQNRLRTFLTADHPSKSFAEKIDHNGSGRLEIKGSGRNIIKRDPDATFQHDDALWPGVVIEVAYSQSPKDIPNLADDYILETNGSVRVVVGLGIDYKTKKGTISIWRPNYVTNDQGQLELEAAETLSAQVYTLLALITMLHAHIGQVFRDELGCPNLSPDAGLKLELKDFAPEILADGVSGSFLIDSVTLCRFLDKAEQVEQKAKQVKGIVQHFLPGAKKRRRENSPPEEINSEDDRRFADDERRVRARASEEDSSYNPSQSENVCTGSSPLFLH